MSMIFTQTNSTVPCGAISACSGATMLASTIESQIQEGGTPGSAEQVVALPTNNALRGFFVMESPAVGEATWAAGDWVTRFNITTAQDDTFLREIHICRVNSSCGTVHTVASETGLAIALSGGGVFTRTINAAESVGDATDRIYIVVVASNEHTHTTRNVGVTPDQDIDTPIVSTTPDPVNVPIAASRSVSRAAALAVTLGSLAVPLAGGASASSAGVLSVQAATEAPVSVGVQAARSHSRAGALDAGVPQAITLSESTHIPAGGETETTQQLTAGSGTFSAGRISDDTNPVVSTIGEDGYTEHEWALELTEDADPEATYELAVFVDGEQLTGAVAEITVGVPAVSVDLVPARSDSRAGALDATLGATSAALAAANSTSRAGALSVTPGAQDTPLLAASSESRAQPLSVTPGAAQTAISPAGSESRAGALSVQLGVASSDLVGARSESRAGPLSVTAALPPVAVDLVASRSLSLAGQLGVTTAPVSVALEAGRSEGRAGVLSVTAADQPVAVALVGAQSGSTARALTTQLGAASVVLAPATSQSRGGVLVADLSPLTTTLEAAGSASAARSLDVTLSATATALAEARSASRAGALTVTSAEQPVSVDLQAARSVSRGGVLATSLGALATDLASARSEGRAAPLSVTLASAETATEPARSESRAGVLSVQRGAAVVALVAARSVSGAGILDAEAVDELEPAAISLTSREPTEITISIDSYDPLASRHDMWRRQDESMDGDPHGTGTLIAAGIDPDQDFVDSDVEAEPSYFYQLVSVE